MPLRQLVLLLSVLPGLPGAGCARADTRADTEGGAARRVVVIGCDGLSPQGITGAKAPVLRRLMKEGAYTLHARAVLPTDSSPNWASMIMGAGPEQHGVTSNDWEPGKFEVPP